MPRKFKEARQIHKLKVIEAAAKLGVSQPTLSAWEGERKSPGLDNPNLGRYQYSSISFACHRLCSANFAPFFRRLPSSPAS